MNRALAILWLAFIAVAAGYLTVPLHGGLNFRTDLLALLPHEEQDPLLQKGNDAVTTALSRQVIILIGDPDRENARTASATISRVMTESGLLKLTAGNFTKDRLQKIGELYFPYRRGLLSENDRQSLLKGNTTDIVTRALSQVYSFMGVGSAHLLRSDPFFLLPSFLTSLPLPTSQLSLDDGLLTARADGLTWILIAGQVNGDPYALDVQDRFADTLDNAVLAQGKVHSGIEALSLGAIFFARAGAKQAMNESSLLGIASMLGTILLVITVFRALTPLLLNLLAITVGVLMALALSLWVFGELHVMSLLFGTSLIGIAVDYGLQYCSETLAPDIATPSRRLKRVLIGITVGMLTTVISYLTLFLAPFPGLHQIALFAAIGLLASWTTVVLWFPLLDHSKKPGHGRFLLSIAGQFLNLWEAPRHRHLRFGLFMLAIVAGTIGSSRFHVDDDVRHMQSLSPLLVKQQERIQSIMGIRNAGQVYLVQAPTDEIALEREEVLVDRLRSLVSQGALTSFQAPSQYIPSTARQLENRNLIHRQLDGPPLDNYLHQLGSDIVPVATNDNGAMLALNEALHGPLSFLSALVLTKNGDEAMHVVTLDGVKNPNLLASSVADLPGVRFIDPTNDFSALLGKYRNRAFLLLIISAVLMAPVLLWRYGMRGGFWVLLPPVTAAILAPALCALGGGSFTFFDAMALVLVLSIGIDYSVFLAETSDDRKSVTMVAVGLAAATTLMSFGLLTFSGALAVHNFGTTMLVGVLLAFILSPFAVGVRPRTKSRP